MGCIESSVFSVPEPVPVASDFDVAHEVDPSIPSLGGFSPSPHQKTELKVPQGLFGRKGSNFEIKTSRGASFNGIKTQYARIRFHSKSFSATSAHVILLDAQNAPIAVCRKGDSTCTIYTPKPLFKGQAKSGHNYEGMELFTYAKVLLDLHTGKYNVIFDNQSAPSYTTYRVNSKRVVKREGVTAAMMVSSKKPGDRGFYEVTVCPGIDPCMIVCLAAICDILDTEAIQ